MAYQPNVHGSCDGRTTRMCGEVAMAELWEGVGEAAMPKTHKAQEGGFWWGEMLTLAMKPLWVHYKLDEAIEMPCSDLLASHQRNC
jgi:hypothetical protein